MRRLRTLSAYAQTKARYVLLGRPTWTVEAAAPTPPDIEGHQTRRA